LDLLLPASQELILKLLADKMILPIGTASVNQAGPDNDHEHPSFAAAATSRVAGALQRAAHCPEAGKRPSAAQMQKTEQANEI